MKRTRLGQSDLEISRILYGSMGRRTSSEADRIRSIHAAIDAGTTSIDTAPLYDFGEVEKVLGKAIRDRRERVEILSKVGLRWDGNHGDTLFEFEDESGTRRAVRRDSRPVAIRKDVEESLGRLGTDRIDLCQIHHPDPRVPIEESLGELGRLAEEGKILHLGVSNFSGRELDAAVARAPSSHPVASDQLHYSLLSRGAERDIVPLSRRHGFGLLAYTPLEAGALTDSMLTPDRLDSVTRERSTHFRPKNAAAIRSVLSEKVAPIAARHAASVTQVCLAWLLHQEHVDGVIVGASSVEQVIAHAAASDLALEPGEVESIGQAFTSVDIDPMAGQDWRTRADHFVTRARRRLGRILRRR